MTFHAPDGTVLAEALGAGGFFDVALVRDGDALLVCKRLAPRMLREPDGRASLVREAELLAAVRHAALPMLVRVGADAQGPFVLETYAEGVSLRALSDRWAERSGPVPPSLFAHVAQAAAEALADLADLADAAGPLGFVHGDLGPDHLIFGPIGEVRVIDLGASRFRDMRALPSPAERGTLPYVAPEIARGEAPPSAAGDVYSLAATLLFLATGAPPCHARDEAARLVEIGERGVRVDAIDSVPWIGRRSRDALRAALAFDPTTRLSRARDLASALAPA